MKYNKEICLKNGVKCVLKSAEGSDAEEVYANFNLTHGETEYLLSYPDENSFDIPQEREFLLKKEASEDEILLCAAVDGRIVGTASIETIGRMDKIKHRAKFGIGIEKAYWGLGIGRALTEACIESAKKAGYIQIELDAVSTNENAVALYRSIGFIEYGRNPKGFRTRAGKWQELILMRLELTE